VPGGPDSRDERDLLDRCRAGDEAAWAALYRAHAPPVTRFVFRVAGPSSDIDDLVQKVFVEVFSSLHGYRGESSLLTWMLGIAARVIGKHVRTEVRWRRRGAALVAADGPPEGTADPSRSADARAAFEVVCRVLDAMDDRHRVVWVMREAEGLSCEEVASALALPVGTVKSRSFEARRRMLEALADAGLDAAWGST
jgi:RNA polymerase sigma-70 factor (ECF subfamily)